MIEALDIAVATAAVRSSPSFPATSEVDVFNKGSLYNLDTENWALQAIPKPIHIFKRSLRQVRQVRKQKHEKIR